MSYFGSTDYLIQVARKLVPGMSLVHKFGTNPNISNAATFEAIWDNGNVYTGHNPTAADTVDVTAGSNNDTAGGTGARSVRLFGLDGSFNLQTEDMDLGGIAGATSAGSYVRLFRVHVVGVGSQGRNETALTVAATATPADVFAVVPALYGQTQIAAYTVPLGHRAYILGQFKSLANKVSGNVVVRRAIREPNESWRVQEITSIDGSGTSATIRHYEAPSGPLPEKTDIYLEASSDTNTVAVSAGFDLLLEDLTL